MMFLPGNCILAKAYAVMEQNTSCAVTVTTAEIIVFIYILKTEASWLLTYNYQFLSSYLLLVISYSLCSILFASLVPVPYQCSHRSFQALLPYQSLLFASCDKAAPVHGKVLR